MGERGRESRQRRSLTRRQLEEPEALDLLALLQTVTEDGRLLDEEIAGLKHWLVQNQASSLPAVQYLRESVEAVLADGRVSAEERAWLQQAVETVLPREEREYAAMRRREAKVADRQAAAEKKAEERELAAISRPIASFDFMVAGVHHEGRAETVRAQCCDGDPVWLVRELRNSHSRNATLVRLENGLVIGYVPEADAVRLAPLLDQGSRQSGSIKKILSGGRAPIPVIWGGLYAPDAPVGDPTPAAEASRGRVGPSEARRSGCSSGIAVVLVLLVSVGLALSACLP